MKVCRNSKTKRIITMISIATMITVGIWGCSNQEDKATTDNKIESTKDQDSSTKNNKNEESTRTIMDMAGREVVIPKEVNRIFPATPIAMVPIYTINPDKLVAKSFELTEEEKKYTVESFHKIPALGKFMLDNTGSEEEILKSDPDVVVFMGMLNEQMIGQVKKMEEKFDIPIIIVDGDLRKSENAYKFLGELLGEEERANMLADYCRETLKQTEDVANDIEEENKVNVYYAQGEDGLTTNSQGSIRTELIELVGGKNVVDPRSEGHASVEVNAEQILEWNPDKIITEKGNKENLLADENLNSLDAIKNKEVYEIPEIPFNWFDTPPSAARILGLKWVGEILYPEKYNYDIKKETKEFYDKFYNIKLSDEDLKEILGESNFDL